MIRRLWIIGLVALLGTSIALDFSLAANRGEEIMRKVDSLQSGFGGLSADVTMTLAGIGEKPIDRIMKYQRLEVDNDGDRSIVVFENPRDVRGTVVLTHAHQKTSDDHWLYLPALHRVKRIASENQSAPFMGSEFAYEDLAAQEVEKFSYRYVGEEPCNDDQCHVIERVPQGFISGYSRQMVWVDQSCYRVRRIDYFNKRNELVKRLNVDDFFHLQSKWWFASRQKMENLKNGKITTVEFRDFDVDKNPDQRRFMPAALSRVK